MKKKTLMEKHIDFSISTINPSSLVGLSLFDCIFHNQKHSEHYNLFISPDQTVKVTETLPCDLQFLNVQTLTFETLEARNLWPFCLMTLKFIFYESFVCDTLSCENVRYCFSSFINCCFFNQSTAYKMLKDIVKIKLWVASSKCYMCPARSLNPSGDDSVETSERLG